MISPKTGPRNKKRKIKASTSNPRDQRKRIKSDKSSIDLYVPEQRLSCKDSTGDEQVRGKTDHGGLKAELWKAYMYMKVSRPGPRRRQQSPQAFRKAAVSMAALKSPEWRLWKAAEAAPHSVCAGAAEAPLAARVGWRPASSSGGTAKPDMLVVRRIELLFLCLFPSVVIALSLPPALA